nr:ABC transporter [uncultured bacterium]
MRRALIIAAKDLLLLARDRAALFWIGAFPVLFALFLAAILEGFSTRTEVALKVAVTDLDRSPVSAEYIARLERDENLDLRRAPHEQARALLRAGQVDGVVLVLPGFGQRADWYASGREALRVESDPSRAREAQTLAGMLLEQGIESAIELDLMADPRKSVRVVPLPSLSRKPSSAELVTPAAILWAVLGCAAAFSVSLAAERRRGTLRRMRALPLSNFEVLAGKALACWTTCMASASLLLAIAVLGFRVHFDQGLAVLLVCAALSLCFTGVMATLSTFGTDERSVAGAGWATLLVLGMLGGVMAPRMIMPVWLEQAGAYSPVRWGLVALEHALWRGGPAFAWVGPSMLLVMVGLALIAFGSLVLKRSAA